MGNRWRQRAGGWGMALALCAAAGAGHAARIASVSPQGEVSEARQVVVTFSEAVAPVGDPRAAAPMQLECTGPAVAGQGRWLDDRRWVWDFAAPLPPGLSCTLDVRDSWRPITGELTGPTRHRFQTGGPAVLQVQPWPGATVDEDQAFIVQLNGPVDEAQALPRMWCEVEGLAERLPVRALPAADRAALLKLRRLARVADRTLTVDCGRPLPQGAQLRLVWGRGIAARGTTTPVTRQDQRLDFRVRDAFTADFSCERERASAPCMPVRPLRVRFSVPVPRAAVAAARLRPAAGGQAIAPRFDDDERSEVSELRFTGPLAERAAYLVELPPGLKDVSGRPLANAGSFPLKVSTGEAPPIAKFATAPFGVIEWKAEPALPITLRHVQGDLRPAAAGGQVRVKTLRTDAEVLQWVQKLARYHEAQLPARELGLPQSQWIELVDDTDAQGRPIKRRQDRQVATREVPLLATEPDVRRLALPQLQGGDPRPFEVVGIPLPEPGYHVVEVVSARLGQALLDPPAPMYVRTGVLVTNLGVHLKLARENAAVWVTTLDRARPVDGADVAISDCHGRSVWSGRTDATGQARVPQRLQPSRRCDGEATWFVSARKAQPGGPTDMAFAFSDWNRGIEPWRFEQPTGDLDGEAMRAHTVFDRTLLRAGETVSMKHFMRRETLQGLADLTPAERPTQARLVHEGSDQRVELPLAWQGVRSATSQWPIPREARLGRYRVELVRPAAGAVPSRTYAAGDFRVEAFRVPLVDAQLLPPRGDPIAPADVALGVQLRYANGGAMAGAALRGSALLRAADATRPGWEGFRFDPPRQPPRPSNDEADDDNERRSGDEGRVVADKVALTTDRDGAARFDVKGLPPVTQASDLVAEVSYTDPNGEVQTVARTVRLWPAAVVPAIRAAGWARTSGRTRFTALALDTQGRALKGQALEVHGRLQRVISTRKRMVGGFYAYDNRTEVQDLGRLCSGTSDERGLLLCDAMLTQAGQVELVVSARDAAGHVAQAATSVWVTRQGELWFEQDNDDRIDVLAEKKRYAPGETARLQVRMPYREATAWVAVEREGVIDTRIVTLRGHDPTVELPIDAAWAPNVYVSVLVVRGRVREVPWSSFFSWGWRSPVEWVRAFFNERPDWVAPTAMVDLSRPSFKLGVAALQVGAAAHELQVQVQPEQPRHAVRGTARVKVTVTQGGQPVPDAEVAFAAVDEGLLALRDNDSWQLLDGLLRQRPWSVHTATAQGEIVGRRHYGRKAVPAGGGGGRGHVRELFDTLLLWQPRVKLDARGQATIDVPLNDSLTAFRLVAVADAAGQRFGTGSGRIEVSQDLQLLSGLPPLVRDGDRSTALLTLRNTTAREMSVRVSLQGQPVSSGGSGVARPALLLPAQDVNVPAGGARELSWPVEVPSDIDRIDWQAEAVETGAAGARDRLKVAQAVQPAVPVRVLQATLVPLDGARQMPVAVPADALRAGGATGTVRGGVAVALQPRLADGLPGVQRWFQAYPYTCLEQKVSRSVGLRDAALWSAVTGELPTHLDADGLAGYFPLRPEDGARGSDRLTALVLQLAHEAGLELPAAARDRMLDGLTAFVEGRIERRFWSPRADLAVRKVAALEALSRYGRAQPRQLGSVDVVPNQWPTAAVIDWLRLLQRVKGWPDQARRLDEARQVLRGRLVAGGTTLAFTTEAADDWWWLMDSPDANAVKLLLAVVDDPAWRDDLPRLLTGALARQRDGAWRTTVANVWGVLALQRFSARHESTPVKGRSTATLAGAAAAVDWAASAAGGRLSLPWPPQPDTLRVVHEGEGRPWLTVQALAAVPLTAPLQAGYTVQRSVSAVERRDPARWSRGDVMRVRLEIEAAADMGWVVVADPVPAGAVQLGSGLGRDSALATRGERADGTARVAYVERAVGAHRSYFEFLPRGRHVVEYTVRLNTPGRHALPPTRVEAMYAPESFAELPNAAVEVAP